MEIFEKHLKEKNYEEAFRLLFTQNKETKQVFHNEVHRLNWKISSLTQKVKYLENQNYQLLKDNSTSLVNKFSSALIKSIKDEDYEYFKDIILSQNFPVNEHLIDYNENVKLLII